MALPILKNQAFTNTRQNEESPLDKVTDNQQRTNQPIYPSLQNPAFQDTVNEMQKKNQSQQVEYKPTVTDKNAFASEADKEEVGSAIGTTNSISNNDNLNNYYQERDEANGLPSREFTGIKIDAQSTAKLDSTAMQTILAYNATKTPAAISTQPQPVQVVHRDGSAPVQGVPVEQPNSQNPSLLERQARTIAGAGQEWLGGKLNTVSYLTGASSRNPEGWKQGYQDLFDNMQVTDELGMPIKGATIPKEASAAVVQQLVKDIEAKKSFDDEFSKLARKTIESGSANLQRAQQGAKGLGKMILQAEASSIQSALDLAENAVLFGVDATALQSAIKFGGAGDIAKQLLTLAHQTKGHSYLGFASRCFGNAVYTAQQANEARVQNGEKPISESNIALYATAQTLIEIATEEMSNIPALQSAAYGEGRYGIEEALDKMVEAGVQKFARTPAGQKALRLALETGAGFVGEGFEEFVGDWAEYLTNVGALIGDGRGKITAEGLKQTLGESIEDFIVGGLSGAFGSGGAVLNYVSDTANDVKYSNLTAKNADEVNSLVQYALEMPQDSKAYEAGKALEEKIARGEQPTGSDVRNIINETSAVVNKEMSELEDILSSRTVDVYGSAVNEILNNKTAMAELGIESVDGMSDAEKVRAVGDALRKKVTEYRSNKAAGNVSEKYGHDLGTMQGVADFTSRVDAASDEALNLINRGVNSFNKHKLENTKIMLENALDSQAVPAEKKGEYAERLNRIKRVLGDYTFVNELDYEPKLQPKKVAESEYRGDLFKKLGIDKNASDANERLVNRVDEMASKSVQLLYKARNGNLNQKDMFSLNVFAATLYNALEEDSISKESKLQYARIINLVNPVVGNDDRVDLSKYSATNQKASEQAATGSEQGAQSKAKEEVKTESRVEQEVKEAPKSETKAEAKISGNQFKMSNGISFTLPEGLYKRSGSFIGHNSRFSDEFVKNEEFDKINDLMDYADVYAFNEDGSIDLISTEDFRYSTYPKIIEVVKVTPNGKGGYTPKDITKEYPSIITNKYAYVDSDYDGFDVEASKKNEKAWKDGLKQYGIKYSPNDLTDYNKFMGLMRTLESAKSAEAEKVFEKTIEEAHSDLLKLLNDNGGEITAAQLEDGFGYSPSDERFGDLFGEDAIREDLAGYLAKIFGDVEVTPSGGVKLANQETNNPIEAKLYSDGVAGKNGFMVEVIDTEERAKRLKVSNGDLKYEVVISHSGKDSVMQPWWSEQFSTLEEAVQAGARELENYSTIIERNEDTLRNANDAIAQMADFNPALTILDLTKKSDDLMNDDLLEYFSTKLEDSRLRAGSPSYATHVMRDAQMTEFVKYLAAKYGDFKLAKGGVILTKQGQKKIEASNTKGYNDGEVNNYDGSRSEEDNQEGRKTEERHEAQSGSGEAKEAAPRSLQGLEGRIDTPTNRPMTREEFEAWQKKRQAEAFDVASQITNAGKEVKETPKKKNSPTPAKTIISALKVETNTSEKAEAKPAKPTKNETKPVITPISSTSSMQDVSSELAKDIGKLMSDPISLNKLANLLNKAVDDGTISVKSAPVRNNNDGQQAMASMFDASKASADELTELIMQLYFKDKESLRSAFPEIVSKLEAANFDRFADAFMSYEDYLATQGVGNEQRPNNELHPISEPADVQGTDRERNSGRESEGVSPNVESTVTEVSSADDGRTGEGTVVSRESNQSEGRDRQNNVHESPRISQRTNGSRDKGYVITQDPIQGVGHVERINNNIEALKVLKAIENEHRTSATNEERDILAKYSGWGGLKDAFATASLNSKGEARLKELESLVGAEEFSEIRGSSNTAFYTPVSVTKSIYKIAERLGFSKGTILEPSCGTGIFFGTMPSSMRNNRLRAVELDPTSARIAELLYPKVNMEVKGFQKVDDIQNNSVGMIVGNVPFDSRLSYEVDGKKELIHNYFILRGLDMLKPNGLMAVITTSGTMDGDVATRKRIQDKANVIAAYRFPSDTFGGTNIIADLLILQKKGNGVAEINNDITTNGEIDGVQINNYFAEHPENILGDVVKEFNSRNKKDVLNVVSNGTTLDDVINNLPASILVQSEQDSFNEDAVSDSDAASNYSAGTVYVDKNGKLLRVNDDGISEPAYRTVKKDHIVKDKFGNAILNKKGQKTHQYTYEKVVLTGKELDRAIALNNLHSIYRQLLDAETRYDDDAMIAEPMAKFNEAYDNFVKEYGTLNGSSKNKQVWGQDSRLQELQSVEEQKGKDENGKPLYVKAKVFTQRIVNQVKTIEKADTAQEAMFDSINMLGQINLDYMQKLYGKSKEAILDELKDDIFELPTSTGEYVTKAQYLSGNVREKLANAREADNGTGIYQKQIEALEDVMPADIPPEQIDTTFGAPWVGADIIEQFLEEDLDCKVEQVAYEPLYSSWTVKLKGRSTNAARWSTAEKSLEQIVSAAINNERITVWKSDDEHRWIDEEATSAANRKVEDLQREYQTWIYRDEERRDELTRIYNDKYNSFVDANYDGSHLAMPASTIKLYSHQADAIYRMLAEPSTLLNHPAGSGKTFEMIGAAHEMHRLGMAQKPLMIVPNHKLDDFVRDYYRMYPTAKILSVTSEQWSKSARQMMLRRIATTDYECIIMRHSSFESFGFSKEYEEAYVKKQKEKAEAALIAAKNGKLERRDISRISDAIKKLDEQLTELQKRQTDDVLPFDQTGIDAIFLDEAHNFKNLFNLMRINVAGSSTSDAKKTTRLHMATEYVRNNNGKLVFATATPISNTIGEIYNMFRYLRPDLLEDLSIDSFDGFASVFTNVVHQATPNSTGTGLVVKDRLAEFKNLPEIMSAFRQFADVVKEEQLNIKKPNKVESHITVKSSELLRRFNQYIDYRKQNLNKDEGENHLVLYGDARMAALDLRLIHNLMIEKGLIPWNTPVQALDLPNSKINRVVDEVFKRWQDSTDKQGTQIIFLDRGVPFNAKDKKTAERITELKAKEASGEITEAEALELNELNLNKRYQFDLYDDIKQKLIAKGVPEGEIEFIQSTQGANSDKKKAALFDRVRNGETRVLIGSTTMMGEGMNVQDKVVALHNVDAPARPSDITQRNARAWRQGNENESVEIVYYSTENSFDAYSWNSLNSKNTFITQALTGELKQRKLEDVSEVSYANLSLEAAANDKMFERQDLMDEISKIEADERNFKSEQYHYQNVISRYKYNVAENRQALQMFNAYKETIEANPSDDFTVYGTKYEKISEAGAAITKAIGNKVIKAKESRDYGVRTEELGTLHGLPINVEYDPNSGDFTLYVRRSNNGGKFVPTNTSIYVTGTLSIEEGGIKATDKIADKANTSALRLNNLMKLDGKNSNSIISKIKTWNGIADYQEKEYKNAQANIKDVFPDAERLTQLKDRLAQVNLELGDIGNKRLENPFEEKGYNVLKSLHEDRANYYEDKKQAEKVQAMKSEKVQETKVSRNRQELYAPKAQPDRIDMDKKQTKAYSQISKQLFKAFGIAHSPAGNYRRNRALGYYVPSRNQIYTKDYNNFFVDAHEIGHALDRTYKFTSEMQEALDAMANKFSDEVKSDYKDDESTLRGEAVAEFIRLYMVNRDGAMEFAEGTDFFKEFEATVDKKDLDKLNYYGKMIQNLIYSDTFDKVKKTIFKRGREGKEQTTLKEKIDRLYTGVVDENYPLKQMVRDIEEQSGKKIDPTANTYLLAEQMNRIDGIADAILHGAYIHAPNQSNMVDVSFDKIIEPIIKKRDDFDAYLKLQHAIELYTQGKKVFADDITLDDMITTVEHIESKNEEFKTTAQELYDWFEKFEQMWLVDEGIITQQTFDMLRALNPKYVRNARVVQRAKRHKDYGASSGRVIQHMSVHGNDLETYSPLESMAYDVQRIVRAQMNHQLFKSMQDLYYDPQTKEAMSQYIAKENPDLVKNTFNAIDLKQKVTDAMIDKALSSMTQAEKDILLNGTDTQKAQLLQKKGILDFTEVVEQSIDNYIDFYTPKSFMDKADVFAVRNGNSVEFFRVLDPTLVNMFANTANKQELNDLVKSLNAMKRTFTRLTTGSNLVFGFTSNIFRDAQMAYVVGTESNPIKFNTDYWKAIGDVVKKSDVYKKYKLMGGSNESILAEGNGRFSDTVNKITGYKGDTLSERVATGFSQVGVMIDNFNNAIETAPRLAEFKRVYDRLQKKGMAEDQALLLASRAAAEVTTDFSQKGSDNRINQLSAIIPFFRAGINGLDRIAEAYSGNGDTNYGMSKGERAKFIAETLAKSVVALTIPTLLLAMLHRDDDEYKKLPDYYKMNYWLINESWFGGEKGKFVRIPKPREVGWLFSDTAEAVINEIIDSEEDNGKALLDAFMDTFLPSTDTVLQPIIDAYANKTWSGGNIVSSTFDPLMDAGGEYLDEVYDDTTSRVAILISRMLPNIDAGAIFTPKGIDYLLKQYTGWIGTVVLPATRPAGDNVFEGIVNKVTADTTYSNRYVNEYYTIKEQFTAENFLERVDSNDAMYKLFTSSSHNTVQEAMNNGIKIPYDSELAKLAKVENTSSTGEVTYGKSPNKRISELYKDIRELNNNRKLTDSQRKAKIEKDRDEINAIAQEMVEIYRAYNSGVKGTVKASSGLNSLDTKFTDANGVDVQLSYDEYNKYQNAYESSYKSIISQVGSSDIAKEKAKKVAKERAKATIRENGTSYFNYYIGTKAKISDAMIVQFEIAQEELKQRTGHCFQDDVKKIIEGLTQNGYERYLLFHAKYHSGNDTGANNDWRSYKN